MCWKMLSISPFISSKSVFVNGNIWRDLASCIAGLDSNTLLKFNEIPYLGNKISIYVDSKYTGVYSDGSMIKPYVTITEALNSIGSDATRGTYGEPTIDTDIHIKDQYCIFVQHGAYNEDIVIPAFRAINLIAIGCVVIGSGDLQYWESTTVRNVTINVYKNMSVTVGQYRSTVAFTTMSKLPDSISTHEHLMSCWQISGQIKANFIAGN